MWHGTPQFTVGRRSAGMGEGQARQVGAAVNMVVAVEGWAPRCKEVGSMWCGRQCEAKRGEGKGGI